MNERFGGNPIGLALGALAAGLTVGLIVPTSDIERRRIGPLRDSVVASARRAGRSAIADAAATALRT